MRRLRPRLGGRAFRHRGAAPHEAEQIVPRSSLLFRRSHFHFVLHNSAVGPAQPDQSTTLCSTHSPAPPQAANEAEAALIRAQEAQLDADDAQAEAGVAEAEAERALDAAMGAAQ